MICRLLIPIILLLTFTGCDTGQREQKLKERATGLDKREQALLAKEKELQLKEQALLARETTAAGGLYDTTFVHHPEIVGRWDVQMECIETDCAGSAVGDKKTEQWDIAYRGRRIIAKAMVNNAVTRVYTGSYEGNALKLVSQSYEKDPAKTTIMHIRLQPGADGRMNGVREIDRPDNCHIVFDVQLTRKQP